MKRMQQETTRDPFEASFAAAIDQLQKSTSILVTGAIVDWSAKLGITPAQWLETYEPEVALMPWQPGEDSVTLKLTVTAKVRNKRAAPNVDGGQ